MRIALASDWYLPRQGGIELHLRDLARQMIARGHEVEVITSTPGDAHPAGDVRWAIPVHRLGAARLPSAGVVISPSVVAELDRILARGRFDVVHSHVSIVSPVAYAATYAARRRDLPVVATFHSVIRGLRGMLRGLDWTTGFSRWGATVTAVSSRVAREIEPLVAPGSGVHLLPNGIDADAWRPIVPAIRPRSVAAHPGMASSPPDRARPPLRLVTAMRLHPKKRPAALVRIVARAISRVGSGAVHLTGAGDGPELARIRRLVARHGISSSVSLRGHLSRDELRELYAHSDLFVSPTTLEAFGLAALEARAAALPVAAMRASGVADFVRDGVEGWLADDDDDLGRIIVAAARDHTGIERIASHNRDVPPPNQWPEVLERHRAIYEAALGGSAGGAIRRREAASAST